MSSRAQVPSWSPLSKLYPRVVFPHVHRMAACCCVHVQHNRNWGRLSFSHGTVRLLLECDWADFFGHLSTFWMNNIHQENSLTLERRRQWHPTPVLLPGRSHGRRSLVGCSPWGREESDMTKRLHFHFSLSCIGEGNGNPLQCFCLENPRDGGPWWAAVYGVTFPPKLQHHWYFGVGNSLLEAVMCIVRCFAVSLCQATKVRQWAKMKVTSLYLFSMICARPKRKVGQ